MKLNYKKLRDFIVEKVEFNEGNKYSLLQGVSNKKYFQKAKTNIIDIDLSKYRVAHYDQFVFNRATTRNGEKISIALRKGESCIVSPSYRIFEVADKNILHPDYLMMWFSRPEFDRYARFKSHGSAHEFFDMEEMRDIELPIPKIEKQKEIISEYEAVENRIQLNKKLCATIEETAQTIYKRWFEDFEFPDENGKPYKSSGGEMVKCEELGKEIPKGWRLDFLKNMSKIKGGKRLPKDDELNNCQSGNPYIKVADMCHNKYLILDEKIQYVDSSIQKIIKNYTVKKDDLIISIVGTIGLINIIDESLDGANLTENCFKITDLQNISVNYLYAYLNSYRGRQDVIEKTVGAVQAKLPMYNVESLVVLCPENQIEKAFSKIVESINYKSLLLQKQTQKLEELKSLLLGKMAVDN